MPAHPNWSRSRSTPARRRLSIEQLEDRLAPANLAITGIQLVDGNNNAITAPVVGQQVYYRASWAATGFTSSAQYVVRYTVDGVSVDTETLNLSNGNFVWFRGTTYASPGTHNVSITVDGGSAVAEDNETDNTLTTSFTPALPTDLPRKFNFPVAGTPNRDYSINNYVDVDPRAGSRADYRGGPFQYDGHDAIDVGPANFADQDAGVPILAAAGGTVSTVVDGNFDRETTFNSRPGNHVIIDHGNGWQTVYFHLAADSIVVKVGDVVTQDQLLGLMGSSGSSTGTHLHWSVFYKGANVETFYAPASYWNDAPPYQGDVTPTVLESGISNYDVGGEVSEGPSKVTVFPTSESWSLYYWYHVSNYRPTTQVKVVWYRPDGTVYDTFNQTPNFQQPSVWYWTIGTGWKSAVGTWQVALVVDNVEIDREAFDVVAGNGVPEASIRQGTTYLLDDRVTPIDFGSAAAGGAAVNRTFTITNRGAVPLSVSLASIPVGFSLVGLFPSSLGANSSATFDLRMDTAVVGRKLGEVNILTNDADEAVYTFLVQGTVTGTPAAGTPVLTLPGPAVATGFGKAPVVIDGAADVSDSDVTTWNGTVLRVAILTNGSASDRLAIRNQGTLAGQVGFTGNTVTFGGLAVGTFTGGQGTAPLVITFGPNNATLTAVQAVLRNLTYANVSATPDTRPRFLGFTFTDSTGKAGEQKVKRVTSTPTPLNDAPVLTPGLVGNVPPINEDQTPVGTPVSAFTSGAILDLDQLQPVGIAVTGATGSFGVWQYSLNGGTTWLLLGSVSASAARLLGPTTLVRFVPRADEFGIGTLTYRAWDGTEGTLGGTFDVSAVAGGGRSAFSAASATSNAVVNAVNDMPTFTPGPDLVIDENAPLTTLQWATAISSGPANENQTVQFVVNVTNPALFLTQPTISPTGVLTFRPAPNALGTSLVTVQLQDSGGGTSAEHTLRLDVVPVNDAPVMTPFTKTIPNTAPFTVASLLGDSVTDPDDAAVEGIAIIGVTRTSGDWQYSLNGGTTWLTISKASPTTARLLRATDLLRFNADTPFAGFGDLRFRAWDQTRGTAGGTADLSAPGSVGAKTAYSLTEAGATIFLGKGVLGLDEDPAFISGGFVAQLLRGDVIDADLGALQGVAITGGTEGAAGHWEYQLTGTSDWLPMTPLTPSAAWLLRPSDSIRFVPAANWHGFFSITYHVWDQTSGEPGGKADLTGPSATGGHASFSVETLTYKDLVVSVNDRPTLAPGNVILTPVGVGATNPPGESVSALLAGRSGDADGDAVGLAIVAADGPGTWQFSTDGGTVWQNLGAVSAGTAKLLDATARLRFLPGPGYTNTSRATISFRAWDGTSAVPDVNATTAYSLVEGTASVASNTAPVLDTTPLVTLPPRGAVSVASLLGNAVSDTDPNPLQGIAVIGTAGSGSWQYSIDGGAKWRPLVVLTEASARLFRPGDLIRFLPAKGTLNGTLRYRAWDQSRGGAGLLDNPLADGVTAYSAEVETAAVNAAPVLTPARVKHFPTRVEGSGPGVGMQVRQLLANAVTDNGVPAPKGIAIAAATQVPGGRWEVSFNGGGTWEELGPVSGGGARLLRLLDRVRFVAPADFAGTVSIIYHAWDQSNGKAGDLASLSRRGGASPFSLLGAASRLTVTNTSDRPNLDDDVPITLTSILPGQVTRGDVVRTLLAGVNDPDPGTALGVAVVAKSSNGVWQFSVNNGATWQDVGNVTSAAALLLRANDRVRFRPAAGFAGVADLTFRAWDRSAGAFGKKFNALGAAFSTDTALAKLAVNTAPVLNTAPTPPLPNVAEDEATPAGATVSSLLGTAVTDPDAGAVAGIAAVGVTGAGRWQYSLDGGTTWLELGIPSPTAARLLRGEDKVRFLPNADVNGQATIQYVAWDQTASPAGAEVTTIATGGSSPFSVTVETATLTITPTNDRPVLAPTVATILPPIRPGTANPPGNTLAALLAGISGDPDGPTQLGVAITGQTGGQGGQWQYSLDGGLNWQVMSTLSADAALLLRVTDLVRFVPNASFTGKATLTYAAWDRTKGAFGDIVDTLSAGLADAFSLGTNVAYLPVNTAPTLKG